MWEILRRWPLFKSVRRHRQKKEEPTNSTVRWITGQMTASFLCEHLCECMNRTTQHCANHRTLQAETISRHARSVYSAAGICLPRLFFVMSYTNQPLCGWKNAGKRSSWMDGWRGLEAREMWDDRQAEWEEKGLAGEWRAATHWVRVAMGGHRSRKG